MGDLVRPGDRMGHPGTKDKDGTLTEQGHVGRTYHIHPGNLPKSIEWPIDKGYIDDAGGRRSPNAENQDYSCDTQECLGITETVAKLIEWMHPDDDEYVASKDMGTGTEGYIPYKYGEFLEHQQPEGPSGGGESD